MVSPLPGPAQPGGTQGVIKPRMPITLSAPTSHKHHFYHTPPRSWSPSPGRGVNKPGEGVGSGLRVCKRQLVQGLPGCEDTPTSSPEAITQLCVKAPACVCVCVPAVGAKIPRYGLFPRKE